MIPGLAQVPYLLPSAQQTSQRKNALFGQCHRRVCEYTEQRAEAEPGHAHVMSHCKPAES